MLRFIIFLYDSVRFFLLFFLLAKAQFNIQDNYFVSGFLYAAPLALFPLMAFFLWLDNKKYRLFAWLYASGKVISVCAIVVSVVPGIDSFITVFLLSDTKKIFTNLLVPFFALADFIFLIPVVVSFKNEISMKNED
ncbi:MAG: hypothetical protein LBD44_06205 [Spirochaetaceae bacterium]|jgi:hypothetical protein|nr:hypothetical protein [Spirochaetaceae bacterium]